MIRIYPEQLTAQLQEGLRGSYFLAGNDPLLRQESQDAILSAAKAQEFLEHQTVTVDNQTDWEALFTDCQSLSLFTRRQTLTLLMPENGPSAAIATRLAELAALLHPDLLLIMQLNKLTKAQENSQWFKALSSSAVMVPCVTPEHEHLPRWVSQRCKNLGISIDPQAVQLLCYCYEGNLLALAQALERLSLLFPEGTLTLPRVEQAVNDAAHFTPYHWVDALLAGKSKRALHILQQLQKEGVETVILLRTLQRELMTLLQLQRNQSQQNVRQLMDKLRVWQNRRPLFSAALQRLDARRLHLAIRTLSQIEVSLKQDYSTDVWPQLTSLSLAITLPSLPETALHG
ncbi:DNA polymerase III subunit delta [Tatumella saanichensis]|uniref:DNA polymerase III subunit delta n=1 Tax=Tatumella saanichensis TaxID=480813 RepID=UPI0004A3B720|nr:DNA polymerase III subunit delta [Tatumella saanichensis]